MDDVTRRIAGRPATLAHMFMARSEVSPDAVAFSYRVNDEWQESTWAQTRELVEALAAGLIGLGIEPQERVAIISETRFEWILADLAITCAGGATTTVHPLATPAEVAHIIDDSDATVVFVESLEQVAKLRAIRADIRKVRKVVLFDSDHPDARVMTLEELLVSGEAVLSSDPAAVVDRLAALRPDMLATIFYPLAATETEGSEPPKGVRHSHAAWTYQGTAVAVEDILGPNDLLFLSLPLSHSSGQLLLSVQMACGFATAVDSDGERLLDNLARVQPTFVAAAPDFLAKAHARIVATQENRGGVERSGSEKPNATIRERFGRRLRFLLSPVAALDPDVAKSFRLAGITILEGYGWPETGAGSFVNRLGDDALGSAGHAFAGTVVRLADDGEVLLRGPGVMLGYHKLPVETASVLRDGWLATGDIGHLDDTGRLRITARKSACGGDRQESADTLRGSVVGLTADGARPR